MNKEKLGAALESLNPENDSHWTADGAPMLDALKVIMDEKIKRADVTNLFPLFTREISKENATFAEAEAELALEKAAASPVVEQDIGEALHEAVDEAERNLDEARGYVDEAAKNLTEKQIIYEKALKARDDAYPPLTNTENIREFLNEQHKQRIARYARGDEFIRKADAAYLAKAPIDKAYAAKRNRGTRRPVHPRVARQG